MTKSSIPFHETSTKIFVPFPMPRKRISSSVTLNPHTSFSIYERLFLFYDLEVIWISYRSDEAVDENNTNPRRSTFPSRCRWRFYVLGRLARTSAAEEKKTKLSFGTQKPPTCHTLLVRKYPTITCDTISGRTDNLYVYFELKRIKYKITNWKLIKPYTK